jgi:hypothetical protein
MIIIDPQTRQRVVTMPHVGDITYNLNGDSAIAEETLPLIGPWNDYTGSDYSVNSRSLQQFAGNENLLFGTDVALEGAKINDLTDSGDRKKTTRSRIKKRYVRIENGKAVCFE